MTERDRRPTAAELVAPGFERAAAWQPAGEWLEYRLAEGAIERMAAVEALHIGKTTQSLKQRLKGSWAKMSLWCFGIPTAISRNYSGLA